MQLKHRFSLPEQKRLAVCKNINKRLTIINKELYNSMRVL